MADAKGCDLPKVAMSVLDAVKSGGVGGGFVRYGDEAVGGVVGGKIKPGAGGEIGRKLDNIMRICAGEKRDIVGLLIGVSDRLDSKNDAAARDGR